MKVNKCVVMFLVALTSLVMIWNFVSWFKLNHTRPFA